MKALKALSAKALEGVPLFNGQMDVDLVLDWIDNLENHFECDGVTDAQKLKVAKSRLRGPALTWWKFILNEREKEGKSLIVSWKGMLTKLKQTYLLDDSEVQMHRKRQNLRQKDLEVQAYIEEFQKLCLRSKIVEDENIRWARYQNGLKWSIQQEMSLATLTCVRQCYQMAIKIEEKSKRKRDQTSRGRGRGKENRGRSSFVCRGSDYRSQGEAKLIEIVNESSGRGRMNRGRGFQGGGRVRF